MAKRKAKRGRKLLRVKIKGDPTPLIESMLRTRPVADTKMPKGKRS